MTSPTSLVAVTLLAASLALAGCGSETDEEAAAGPPPAYSSERVAPLPADVPESDSDEMPSAEDALVELDLDSGAVAALWIDPDDFRDVYVQYSDPDDPDAWTEPALVYEAGDGCLTMHADTAGSTVAVGLGCYEVDTFAQQAPDDGVALVSDDLTSWDEQSVGESIPVPEVGDDGAEVVFRNEVYDDSVDATWRRGEGF